MDPVSKSLTAKANPVRTTGAPPSSALEQAPEQEPIRIRGPAAAPAGEAAATPLAEVSWQTAMKRAIRSGEALCDRLALPAAFRERIEQAAGENPFPVFVPLEFLARMRVGDCRDPLLRQVLPLPEEADDAAGFSTDPVGELQDSPPASLAVGLLKKYYGRALLVTSGACGVHCRYCFRRHFPYDSVPHGAAAWDRPLAMLAGDSSIDEVILSGGDPLVLTDPALEDLIHRIAEVPHVRRLRIHSRMPIVIPQRVTERLLDSLSGTSLAVWMVVHANHPAELDPPTLAALGRLIDRGIPVLNQAVLLRSVNDHPEVLEQLCRKLIDHRVQPYYLHQLDRVAGAAHFEVPESRGRELVEWLRTRLPGYAVPTYVVEKAGEASKTPL